jgi:D-alanyl-D-alanine carboxypeptidase
MTNRNAPLAAALLGLAFLACGPATAQDPAAPAPSAAPAPEPRLERARAAMDSIGLPMDLRERFEADPVRFLALLEPVLAEMAVDPMRFARADKLVALPSAYEATDLVLLKPLGVPVSRDDHRLRSGAAAALSALAKAAAAEGHSLVAASTYRSYAYQETVYARWVRELGQERADRVSARPGRSQHQLGTVVDFAPIDNAFAGSKAGLWTAANAARFGFSLSYPRGLEALTGYDWESWHWRWLGASATALQREFFGDVQHWLILFLEAWNGA